MRKEGPALVNNMIWSTLFSFLLWIWQPCLCNSQTNKEKGKHPWKENCWSSNVSWCWHKLWGNSSACIVHIAFYIDTDIILLLFLVILFSSHFSCVLFWWYEQYALYLYDNFWIYFFPLTDHCLFWLNFPLQQPLPTRVFF